jgi:SAM-dependent methyltransferase
MMEQDSAFWELVAAGLVKSDFEWLLPLRAPVSRIIVFGCWDDGAANRGCREAYALLRILGGTHAVVVDKEAEYIENARRWYQATRAQYPELFSDYDLRFVVSDMTRARDELGSDRFDLAYCSGVLYSLRSDAGALLAAVSTMARVVRPGGWIIANEDKCLDRHFAVAGLAKARGLDNAPAYAYCYQKPLYRRMGPQLDGVMQAE